MGALVLFGWAVLCQTAAIAAQPDGPVATQWNSQETRSARPLNDPANPYAGQYGPLDHWAWEHALPPGEARQRDASWIVDAQISQPKLLRLYVRLDDQDWPVPLDHEPPRAAPATLVGDGLTVAQWYAATCEHDRARYQKTLEQPGKTAAGSFYFVAEGEGDAFRPELELKQYGPDAANYPAIPAWLGENPPLATVFLPDGSILVCGGLGQRYKPRPGQWGQLPGMRGSYGETWRRYSVTGELLEQRLAPPGHLDWDECWSPELYQLASQRYSPGSPGGERLSERSGPGFRVLGRNGWPGQASGIDIPEPVAVAAYQWDGSPLALDAPVPAVPPGTCQALQPQRLGGLYRVQLALGRTTKAPSPFAGTPQGPVVAAATPQLLPVLVTPSTGPPLTMGIAFPAVCLQALDAPENPYAGQYGQWDSWVHAKAGCRNEEREAWNRQLYQRLPATGVVASSAEAFIPAPDSTWRDTFGEVDEEGYMLPLAESWKRARQPQLLRDRRLLVRSIVTDTAGPRRFVFSASGELPLPAWNEMERARRQAELAAYPPIPAWLSEGAPVASFYLLPDGGVVTYGAPGSWQPGTAVEPGRLIGTADWHRYSADGKLLATLSAGEAGAAQWLALTFPAARELAGGQPVQGGSVRVEDGFLMVLSGPLMVGESDNKRLADPLPGTIAAYDWDGKPLPVDQPLTRPDGYCMRIPWDMLAAAQ